MITSKAELCKLNDHGSEKTVIVRFLSQSFITYYILNLASRSQIRSTLKKKAFEEAGVPLRQQQIISQQQTNVQQQQQVQAPKQAAVNQGLMGKSSEVTLNMLNAPESEVDVEGLQEECPVKLEFDGATEEVTS